MKSFGLTGGFVALVERDAGLGYLVWPVGEVRDPFGCGETTADAALPRAVAGLTNLGGELLLDEDGWPGMDAGTIDGRRAWPFVVRASRADGTVQASELADVWRSFERQAGLVPPVVACGTMPAPEPARVASWRSSTHPAARMLLDLHGLAG